MKTVKIGPSPDLSNLLVPLRIEVDFATSAKLDDIGRLEQVLEKAVEDVQKRFAKDGYTIYVRSGTVRPMSQEELLALIPRKIHLAADGQDGTPGWLCKTAHVAAKNITSERDDVTCKLCLKALGQ